MKTETTYEIGDIVIVKTKTVMGYDDDNNRVPFDEQIEAQKMYIIGAVSRRLGKYLKGGTIYSLDGLDYDPPEFKATGSVLLYQCRKSLKSKIIEVRPENLEVWRTNASNP